MASYTPNLNLLMKDPVADGADTFNIQTMLNENWEKIDRQVLRAMAAAAAYDAGKTYQQGDFCTQGGLLYRANQAIAQPEAWAAGHWTAISITDVIRGLTAADVGAAPEGFGIGTYGPNVANLNDAVNSGFYTVNGTYQNGPSDDGAGFSPLLVLGGSFGDRIAQIYYGLNANFLGCIATRYYNNVLSAWSSWEWVNPPMLLGVEYRTAERFNRKPVYAKLVDCGAPTVNGVKTVTFDSTGTIDKIVDCRGESYGSLNSWFLPSLLYGASYNIDDSVYQLTARATSGNGNIYIYSNNSYSSGNDIYALVKYTKLTD